MALHRLLGFRSAVPDPAAVAGFHRELGLAGDDVRGWTGSEGRGVVHLDEGELRRPLSALQAGWATTAGA